MEGQGNAANASNRRWTCEACGCNTNAESDRTCSICGTSNGPSLLRRAGYARSNLFARNFAARRGIMNDELGVDGDEVWERVVDGVELGGDDDEQAIAALAMEVAGVSGGAGSRDTYRQFMEAARSFAMATREIQCPDAGELLCAANANSSLYQPKWMNPSQIGGRMRTGNGIEVGEGENQNVAHLPLGAGEGRALRALESFPRSAPFASFNISSPNSGPERRPRRAFGFRVAFEHPMKEAGSSMGGCYLVGVTTTSFAAFSERNGLQQSPYFWGIEDGGCKYEGSRSSHPSRTSRRGTSSYAVELSPSEATRNADNVLFGSREVVTCVVDFESRTLTFWRDDELIGTIVSNLPRGGNLYPVVVPFNSGSTVAITGMGGNPLPLLRAFATDWKQAQHEKDAQRRKKLFSQRSLLISNGKPTQDLLQVLRTIFSWYATGRQPRVQDNIVVLNRVQAARLWYRCGMKLSCLDSIMEGKSPPATTVSVGDFIDLVSRVISEEEDMSKSGSNLKEGPASCCEIGDKVELVEGYERYGDASNGPLAPGDRGAVVELQEGPDGESRSVRVLYNGRRWWYQPHALLPERSGLTESSGVWFLRTILRAHGYDHTTLRLLCRKVVTTSSWQVGDVVIPKLKSSESDMDCIYEDHPDATESRIGRIVPETSSSASTLTARGRDSGTVLVEYVGKLFGDAAGVQVGTGLQGSRSISIETRRVRVTRLIHSNVFHGVRSGMQKVDSSSSSDADRGADAHDMTNQEDQMDVDTFDDYTVSDKLLSSIKEMKSLDVSAIETATKECKRNAAALASAFAAGLPEAFMAAVDTVDKRLKRSDEGEGLSQSISVLGRLAVVVAEQLFPDESKEASEDYDGRDSVGRAENASAGDSRLLRAEEALGDLDRHMSLRRYVGSDQRESRSQRLSDSAALMPDVHRAGRLSSLQQRRSMMLALMSRARRSSLNEFSNREANNLSREAGMGQIMPSLGPFRQEEIGSLILGNRGGGAHGNNWDGDSVDTDEAMTEALNSNSCPNNGTGTLRNDSGAQRSNGVSVLELILRGRGDRGSPQPTGKSSASTQSASFRALIMNGLLRDSLVWVKAATDAQSKKMSAKPTQRTTPCLHTAADEEGMPILQLAICFGCSEPILRHLIKMGAPVGEAEIKLAASTNQTETLSTLLRCAVYKEGMVDLQTCSPEVSRVIREASSRQEGEERRMREHAGAFMVGLLRKLLQLGLSSRRLQGSADLSSRAIAGALVGNVLLRALYKRQKHAESEKPQANSSAQENSDVSNRGRYAIEGAYSALSSTPQGLLCALPKEIVGRSLLEESSHFSTFLMLAEDYLCSKDINDGAIGLTLLSSVLERFPIFSVSSEMERYGFRELVTSHDAFASNRLAEISSHVAAKASSSASKSSQIEELATSGVVLCPKQHAATLHVTRHSSFRCDLCGKGVERGRIMHGCRECDWDACERCTDLAEGGIVKWNHIRDLASECQRLLASTALSDREAMDELDELAERAIETQAALDNSSEIHNLSIRLLQRDCESIKELSSILGARGRLTVHQFLTVILPALHASLLGRAVENGRFHVSQTGFSRRTKKPRVIGSTARDSEDAFHSHFNDDRLNFCKAVVKHLVKEASPKESLADKRPSDAMESEKVRNETSDEEGEGSDDGEEEEEDSSNPESDKTSIKYVPELLRRLQQVLSLYENVTLLQHFHSRSFSTGLKGGDLQSLTKPLEIKLTQLASRKRASSANLLQQSTRILAEPLMSVSDLELHVLRTCRIFQPQYLAFCRQLAMDRAIIIEQPPPKRNDDDASCKWRVARVLGFDEESGSHAVQYLSGLTVYRGSKYAETHELRSKDILLAERLRFDENENRLMLSARNYYILSRQRSADDAEAKSPFDMEHLLTDGIVPVTEGTAETSSRPSIGARVESNCSSSDWKSYTVVAVEPGSRASGQKDEAGFVLVSDAGEVHLGVQAKNIRGLDLNDEYSDDGNGSERGGRNIGGGRAREGRGHVSRTFPFLTVRRQSSDGARNSPSRSSGSPVGVLKRTWSALSPIESMCPIELDLTEQTTSEVIREESRSGRLLWHCSIGDSMVDVFAERSEVELPPRLRVCFGLQETNCEVGSTGNSTLISLLWRLHRRAEQQVCCDQPYSLVYTVSCEPRTWLDGLENFTEHSKVGSKNSISRENRIVAANMGVSHTLAPDELLVNSVSSLPSDDAGKAAAWQNTENRSRKLRHMSTFLNEEEGRYRGLCDGLDEICVQCMEIIGLLCDVSEVPSEPKTRNDSSFSMFENPTLSRKLMEQLEDPLMVVGGALPQWCIIAPSFAPRVFSYDSRRLLLERAAFGVSRSTLRQQESKVNVGRLRQRMASLRARAVELVGEAFSGGAEDPTALQLQADELYGMEEALAARVKAAFRAERWEEHTLQVAKAAVHRDLLISDAASIMDQYANDSRICRRRLEVRFDGESGFDAASGDEAGVTRGFYADVAEALLSCEIVAGVSCSPGCIDLSDTPLDKLLTAPARAHGLPCRLPLWIPDVDASGQVIIPTPRADPQSGLGVYPRPLSRQHPQARDVYVQFRFMGRLFAAATRDGFMFPLPLSSAFLKLVQHGHDIRLQPSGLQGILVSTRQSTSPIGNNDSHVDDAVKGSGRADREILLNTYDLPRPGFLGGEVFAVDMHICRALDRLDESDPPLSKGEVERGYKEIASDKNFARVALGKTYDCSFEDYFQDRTFVDPLDPTQGPEAAPLCPKGHVKSVSIHNVREWVALAKDFILHDGVIMQALAFRRGIEDFFPAEYLRLFTPEELQSDVCGVGDNVDNWTDADVRKLFKLDGGKGAAEALVAVAAIGGEGGAVLSRRFGPSSPTINFVVKALLEATPKLRRQFLSFVTSVPIFTPGQIEVVPMVSPSGEFMPMRDPGCLPRANTCARRLYLPKFETYESFCQVLWAVVREESKFKGFYEWRGS